MDRELLSELNNAVQSKGGLLIRQYLVDRLIDYSASLMNAEQIKGMGILINDLNEIERDFRKQQQERT